MCWCIYTKQWFKYSSKVEFIIIDEMGEDIIINCNEHNKSLLIKQNKIYIESNSENEENLESELETPLKTELDSESECQTIDSYENKND
jgi:hypothetical protein